MSKPEKTSFSLRHRLHSFRHALRGIAFVCKSQHNAWIHLLAIAAVTVAGYILDISRADWCWLIACIALVCFAELINTAIEYVCDAVSPQHSMAVKHAKDIAAGAVLVCAVAAALIGALVIWPYLS